MPLVVPNSALVQQCKNLMNIAVTHRTFTMHLYVNNYDPDRTSVLGDFDEVDVGDVPSYAAQVIGAFGTPTLGVEIATTVAPILNFAFDATTVVDTDVYGYYVTDDAGALAWAQRFSIVPQTIPAGVASEINQLPAFEVASLYP